MEPSDEQNINAINQPVRLPCGLELPNRLVKAAMAPCFSIDGQPSSHHHRLYRQWSRDRFGLLITENVQVCPRHLASPGDVTIQEKDNKEVPTGWEEWARVCRGTPTLVQLSHAGLQSPRGCGRPLAEPSVAPSAGRLSLGTRLIDRLAAGALFNYSREASVHDISRIVELFRSAALFCHSVGFQGVQLHCSHGFLLSAFLSPKTNRRQDEYGMSNLNRLRILFEIIDAIRSTVPASFCLAIKLNCSDLSEGGVTMEEALSNIKMIVSHGGIDLIEISGGTYSNFPTSKVDVVLSEAKSGKKSEEGEAYYTSFTKEAVREIRKVAKETGQPSPALMHTGGFRSRRGMATAITQQETDLIGLGRPACLDPSLCAKILDPLLPHFSCPDPPVPGVALWNLLIPVRIIGAGFKTVWYTWQLHLMADYQPPDLGCSALGSLRVLLPLGKMQVGAAFMGSVMGAALLAWHWTS